MPNNVIENLAVSVTAQTQEATNRIASAVSSGKSQLSQLEKPIPLQVDTKGFISSISGLADTVMGFLGKVGLAKMGFDAIIQGIESTARTLGGSNTEFEKYQVQFAVLLGSMEKANQRFAELVDFAVKTPFELNEIIRADKILQSFGVHATDAAQRFGMSGREIRQIIGDVASAAGVQFEAIAQYLGRFISGVTGEALERFSELAVVTREELKQVGVQFDKAGSMITPVDEATKKMLVLLREKFGGMMLAQSYTLEGMLSNLRDWATQTSATLSRPIFDSVKFSLASFLDYLSSPAVTGAVQGFADATAAVINEWAPRFIAAFQVVTSGFGALASAIGSSLSGILEMAQSFGTAIWEALQWINPWATHSPSLVSQVESGVSAIEQAFSRFEGLGSTLAGATAAVQAFAAAAAQIDAQMAAAEAAVSGLQEALSAAQEEFRYYSEASLVGTKAYSDAIFSLDQQMAQLQAQALNIKMKVDMEGLKSAEDKLAEAQRKLSQALVGGASARTVGMLQRDVDTAQSALDVMKKSSPFPNATEDLKEIEKKLSKLGMQKQWQQLQEQINLGPLRKQLEDLKRPVKELSFDEIAAGIKRSKGNIDQLTPQLAAAQKYMSALRDSSAAMAKSIQEATEAGRKQAAAIEAQIKLQQQLPKGREEEFRKALEEIENQATAVEAQIQDLKLSGASADSIKPLEARLDALRQTASRIRLQEKLELDPIRQQLANLKKPLSEADFGKLQKQMADSRREISQLTPDLDALTKTLAAAKAAGAGAGGALAPAKPAEPKEKFDPEEVKKKIDEIKAKVESARVSIEGWLAPLKRGISTLGEAVSAFKEGGLEAFMNVFIREFGADLAPLGIDLLEIRNVILQIAGAFQRIWAAFQQSGIGGAIKQAWQELQPLLEMVGKAIQDLWAKIDWAEVGKTIGDVLGGIGKALGDLWAKIDWAEVQKTLGDFMGQIGRWIGDAWAKIDWDAVWRTAGDIAGQIGRWIGDAWAKIDWNAVLKTAGDIAGQVGRWIGDAWAKIDWNAVLKTAGDIAGMVGGWLGEQWAKIDWGSIWKAAGDLAGQLGGWLGEQWAKIDWKAVLSQAQDWMMQLIAWFESQDWNAIAAGAGQFVNQLGAALRGALMQALKSAVSGAASGASEVDWSQLILSIVNVLGKTIINSVNIIANLVEFITVFLKEAFRGVPVLDRLIEVFAALSGVWIAMVRGLKSGGVMGALEGAIGKIVEILKRIPKAALDLVSDVLSALGKFAIEFGSILLKLIGDATLKWVKFGIDWIKLTVDNIGTMLKIVVNFAGEFISIHAKLIQDFLEMFVRGLARWINDFSGTLNDLIRLILSFVGDMLAAGKELMDNFFAGISQVWATILVWAGAVITEIVEAILSLISDIISAGEELMGNFLSGISNGWRTIQTWFEGLGSLIADTIRGGIEALQSVGEEILKNVKRGIEVVWDWFSDSLGKLFAKIGEWFPDFVEMGRKLVNDLWMGFMEIWDKFWKWFTGQIASMLGMWPFGSGGQSLGGEPASQTSTGGQWRMQSLPSTPSGGGRSEVNTVFNIDARGSQLSAAQFEAIIMQHLNIPAQRADARIRTGG